MPVTRNFWTPTLLATSYFVKTAILRPKNDPSKLVFSFPFFSFSCFLFFFFFFFGFPGDDSAVRGRRIKLSIMFYAVSRFLFLKLDSDGYYVDYVVVVFRPLVVLNSTRSSLPTVRGCNLLLTRYLVLRNCFLPTVSEYGTTLLHPWSSSEVPYLPNFLSLSLSSPQKNLM